MTNGSRMGAPGRDPGAILVITLILTVIMSVIVLAMASFAITGLKTSKVTTERTESNAVTSAAVTWFIEELAAKRIDPADPTDCDAIGVVTTVPPGALGDASSSATVTCTVFAEIGGHPTVELTAIGTTADGASRTIDAVVQVPRRSYTTQIRSWVAD